MTDTTRFNLKGGKHIYVDVPKKIFDQFNEAQTEHKFLVIEGHRFNYAGEENGMRIFNEADVVEIRVAAFAQKIMKKHFKLAQSLLDKLHHESNEQQMIEEQINNIGVKNDDPLVKQIREIKQEANGEPYPKDKAKIQVLWWEAKRNAFHKQMQEANVKMPTSDTEKERSIMLKVLDELNNRITNAVRDYKNFPGDEDQ